MKKAEDHGLKVDPQVVVRRVIKELRAFADQTRAEKEKAYLRSSLKHFGVRVPQIASAAKRFVRSHPNVTREELLAVVELAWSKEVHELRMFGIDLLMLSSDLLEPTDLQLVEHLLRGSKTWALVDPLAIQVAGSIIENHPEAADSLDRWAEDHDFWVRRAAMLALLVPLRRGDGDFARFARYADAMLEEKEFFIRKAIGWVLREASKQQPELVYGWIEPRAGRASGVTVREAIKYLSEEQKSAVLDRHARG